MDDRILHDIARIRRMVGDAAKQQDIGKDVSAPLASIAQELAHLQESVEAAQEQHERGAIDQRTRFVSELAVSFLRAMLERPGGVLTESELQRAVDMAAEIVKRVQRL